jgi:hypothetical protein
MLAAVASKLRFVSNGWLHRYRVGLFKRPFCFEYFL